MFTEDHTMDRTLVSRQQLCSIRYWYVYSYIELLAICSIFAQSFKGSLFFTAGCGGIFFSFKVNYYAFKSERVPCQSAYKDLSEPVYVCTESLLQ